MAKKLYVGNLPFSVDQQQLQELFTPYGEIEEAIVISNKFSGRSKGFGFVTFKEEADAEKATAEMNEKEVDGRPLKVNEAKPFNPDKPRKSFNRKGKGGFNRGPRNDNGDQGTGEADPSAQAKAREAKSEKPKDESKKE